MMTVYLRSGKVLRYRNPNRVVCENSWLRLSEAESVVAVLPNDVVERLEVDVLDESVLGREKSVDSLPEMG